MTVVQTIVPITGIRQAFYKRFQEVCNDLNITQIAWPNTQFTEPKQLYVRPYISFARTTQASLGQFGYELTTGFFQISIVGTANSGEKQLDKLSEYFILYFQAGIQLQVTEEIYLLITSTYRSGMVIDNNRPFVPITCNFNIYSPKAHILVEDDPLLPDNPSDPDIDPNDPDNPSNPDNGGSDPDEPGSDEPPQGPISPSIPMVV